MGEHYVAPQYLLAAFNCPYCGVYAKQHWLTSAYLRSKDRRIKDIAVSICEHCGESSAWIEDLNSMGPSHIPNIVDDRPYPQEPYKGKMIYPLSSLAPIPTEDMPEELKTDYLEAREIVGVSPRAAAALLRLCIQKLMPILGEKGKNINDDIGELVKKGLPIEVQQALDSVRVIGNGSVHPGTIDMNDDRETALTLFSLLNFIVERTITQQKKIQEIYSKLPQSQRDGIKRRDTP
jgi:hypothetical protein